MGQVLVLTEKEAESLISLKDVIPVVEKAFGDFARGKAVLPPAIGFPVEKHGGEMHIKSGYLEESDSIAVKIASSYPKNPAIGLPTVQASILLFNPENGSLAAVMGGRFVTNARTAAAGAVAAKFLSKKSSRKAGVIGAGVQGRMQLKALCCVRDIEEAKVFSTAKEHSIQYAKEMGGELGVRVAAVDSAREAVEDVDVLITATPSREPIVEGEWLAPGTHINAFGADNPKKQELHASVFLKAGKIIADRLAQCKVAGEIHHAIEEGALKEENVYAELGEIVIGRKKARENDDEITVFDSTGVAIQDVSVAALVFEKARGKGVGKTIEV